MTQGGYYLAGHPQGFSSGGTTSAGPGVWLALPFLAARGGTIDKVLVSEFLNLAAQTLRIGIWSNVSATNLYPDVLRYDSGDIATALNSLRTAAAALVLVPASLYWVTFQVSSGTPTFASLPGSTFWPVLGVDQTNPTLARIGWSLSHAYGAWGTVGVTTFPAGGTFAVATATMPLIGLRFSA